jgi:hypothetical protein
MVGWNALTVFFLIMAVGLVPSALVLLLYYRFTRKMLSPLLAVVEGEIPNFSENLGVTSLEGQWGGCKIKIEIGVTKVGVPDWIAITFLHRFRVVGFKMVPAGDGHFSVFAQSQEEFLPWPTYKINLNDREMADSGIVITGQAGDIRVFLNANRAQAVKKLFAKGFNILEVSADSVKVSMTTYWGGPNAYKACRRILRPDISAAALQDIKDFCEG